MNENTVLCVDDEPRILSSLKRLLRKESYDVVTATSGEEGLQILETQPIRVVISDHRMPGMTGTEFIKKVKERYPGTVCMIVSGYADVSAISEAEDQGYIAGRYEKPWNDEELKAAVRACFEEA